MSVSAFSARHGLAAQRLGWWKKRLDAWRDDDAGATVSTLVPAVVRLPAGEAAVAIRLPSGAVVEVADAAVIDPAWLTAVVHGLSRSA